MKRVYLYGLQIVRRLLVTTGLMRMLDRWARHSRTGLWVRSWFAIYDLDEMVRVGVPWWTFKAVDLVETHLATRSGARVFEWGSGVSTLWLAQRCAEVHSVEHDPDWASLIAPRLPEQVSLHVVPPVQAVDPAVASRKRGHSGLDFQAYVDAIHDVPGEFDLVIIDGRAREACLGPALGRLSTGGLLLLDNVDRRRYRSALAALGDDVSVAWTRGRTPALPYPTRTAVVRWAVPERDTER